MHENVLFDNIRLLSPVPDPGSPWLSMPSAWVAVSGGRIAAVSDQPLENPRQVFRDEPYSTYSGRGRLLMPALANLHGHIAMTLFRNQADDYNLHDWLFKKIFPREQQLNQQLVRQGTALGLIEMIRSGTGAAADMYFYHEAVAETAAAAGFRLNFSCISKTVDAQGREVVDAEPMKAAQKLALQAPDDLLRASLLVHSVYLYEPDQYPLLAQLAVQLDCPVQIHISETEKEVSDCLERYGQRPPAQLASFGFFKTPTLAAHCVHLDAADRQILANPLVTCVHNPASNMKLGSGFADVGAMLEAGIRTGIGTDGPASNNNLDLFRDMRLAAFLAKGLRKDASVLPAETVLRMVTLDGMKGLGYARSGMIEQGFAADLQIIDLEQPQMTPLGQPAAAVVYSGSGCFVESLMVAGRWLMEKRQLKTIDEEKVMAEAVTAAELINRL